ncbi:MAG: DUF2267 domain-containing protein [Deltaproteobacteria bacterium]|nr:DUF2267 domain-containing protein [Deltaproteobacteria bacterium]
MIAELQQATDSASRWLEDLATETGTSDDHRAWAYLRAALHALRDRLSVEECAQLAAQMPLVVRGLFYEGWRPAHKPDKSIKNRQELLARISAELHGVPGDPQRIGRALFRVLEHHLPPGEVTSLQHVLPHDLRSFWKEI